MNDDAFLRAIREDRDDPARRLVYADWLEERGDARGEYLRLSCRLAELLAGIDPAWLAAVRESRSQVGDVRLRSGRSISLDRLQPYHTYGGLLHGLPTTQMNQKIIERLLAEERNRPLGGEPYLIRPEEKAIEYREERPYPFGQPAELPHVVCVGQFDSQPARDQARHGSTLVVIWFQDEFALPIGPNVWEQLLGIDWDRHAIDFDY